MPGNYLPSTQELLYAKRKTLFPGQRPLTTGWLLSSCLGLHHCPALMGLMFPVEKLVPRGGWFSDHWSRVDGTFGFLVQISLQAMGGCSLQLGPSNSLEEETSWALQCPTSCFTWILTAGGATTKNPTTTGLRCCQDVGGLSMEGTVCQGRGGSMERRPGGARSLYLLHRVSEKPSSLCTEKAEPQVGFQSSSASGLGELMFCCGHRSVESWRCSVSARLHQAHSWAK